MQEYREISKIVCFSFLMLANLICIPKTKITESCQKKKRFVIPLSLIKEHVEIGHMFLCQKIKTQIFFQKLRKNKLWWVERCRQRKDALKLDKQGHHLHQVIFPSDCDIIIVSWCSWKLCLEIVFALLKNAHWGWNSEVHGEFVD